MQCPGWNRGVLPIIRANYLLFTGELQMFVLGNSVVLA